MVRRFLSRSFAGMRFNPQLRASLSSEIIRFPAYGSACYTGDIVFAYAHPSHLFPFVVTFISFSKSSMVEIDPARTGTLFTAALSVHEIPRSTLPPTSFLRMADCDVPRSHISLHSTLPNMVDAFPWRFRGGGAT